MKWDKAVEKLIKKYNCTQEDANEILNLYKIKKVLTNKNNNDIINVSKEREVQK